MQSSFWKLLTAAGIIGLGTLGVLEVQHRLSRGTANGSTAAAAQAAAAEQAAAMGSENSVVPDATTDFDRLLASNSDLGGLQEPDAFDGAGGPGTPAPPAVDDGKFYVAGAVDRTVHKDELTDGASPFAMEEPSIPVAESDVTRSAEADPASALNESTDEGTAIEPVSFSADEPVTTPGSAASATNAVDTTPLLTLPAEDASAEIPFAIEADPEPEPAAPTPAVKPAPGSDRENDAMLFFNGDGGKSESSSSAATEPSQTSSAEPPRTSSAVASPAARNSSTPKPAVPAASAERLAPAARPASDIQQTAMTQDENMPDMFLPEPVPDVTRVPADDPAPLRRDRNDLPDTPGRTTPGRDLSSEPFTTDEPEPGTGLSRPRDPRDSATPEFPAFDEPTRDRATGSDPFGGPGDEPTAPGDRTNPDEPLPLPSADDPRDRVNPPRTGTSGSGAARTVSESMRPQLTIQKRAPDTATVGVSHEYTIVVENEGESPALDVIVEDELGPAADIVDSRPAADFDRRTGILSWTIAELAPQERREIVVRITPTGEGTLDGVATVRFKAQVKSATVITAPKLQIDVTGPREVKVGDEVALRYVISNNGSGDASAVILRSVLPPGLKHPEGGDLEYEIDLLRSGERETVDLTVVAAEPGETVRVVAEVTSSGVAADQTEASIAIIGSQLSIERLGPERRVVGRSAKYQNIIRNETNFDATNAIVVEQIPDGMKFLSATGNGQYSPDRRQVQWDIAALAAGEQLILEIELVAETAGQMESIVEITEDAGFRSRAEENTVVTVEDLHNVTADISRQDKPVAIGERFGFTITIDNRGTAVARNIEMSVEVPPEIKVLAAGTRDVPGKLMRNNVVRYSTVASIPPNETMTFQITLQGQQAVRNGLVQARLSSDEMQEPLIVSESVTVFDDQP